MSLPVHNIPSDAEDDSIFGDDEMFPPMIDIHVDPHSLPVPIPAAGTADTDPMEESEDDLPTPHSPLFDYNGQPFYNSEGEWIPGSPLFGHDEEDPSEEDPMDENHVTTEEEDEDSDEEPEEADPLSPSPYDIGRFPYHSGRPRTIRTARKRVHLPRTVSTSIPTPLPAPLSSTPSTPTDIPSSSESAIPLTTYEDYIRAWAEYSEAHPTTHGEVSTSAAPPTLTTLAEQVDAQDARIEQLEHTVDALSGPANIDMMQQDLWTMEQQVQQITNVTQDLSAALPTIGNERMERIEARLGQIEGLLSTLQSQILDLQRRIP